MGKRNATIDPRNITLAGAEKTIMHLASEFTTAGHNVFSNWPCN